MSNKSTARTFDGSSCFKSEILEPSYCALATVYFNLLKCKLDCRNGVGKDSLTHEFWHISIPSAGYNISFGSSPYYWCHTFYQQIRDQFYNDIKSHGSEFLMVVITVEDIQKFTKFSF